MKETTLHFSNICMKCNSPQELPGTECNSFAKLFFFFNVFVFFISSAQSLGFLQLPHPPDAGV